MSNLNRREFIQILSLMSAAYLTSNSTAYAANKNSLDIDEKSLYDFDNFGDVRLLHFTDCHAQLNPIYFREPNINIGVSNSVNKVPHIVGNHLLEHYNMNNPKSNLAYAYSYLDFENLAKKFGKVGGFSHLKTLVDQLREGYGQNKTILMDGGDTWQGSGTSYWTDGLDMVQACNLLGVDVMTGHWEFTYGEEQVLKNLKNFKGEFVAQNVNLTEEALFDEQPVYDEDTGHAFKPYTIKKLGNYNVAVIGQSFPYTPIANPRRLVENWSFGIKEKEMQILVDKIRNTEKADLVVVLSHNGMDVDLKMAANTKGIDAILGGHTHDGVPHPVKITNKAGEITLVTNAGSNGKFLGCFDIKIKNKKIEDFKYRLLPIFSNLLKADKMMDTFIQQVREPYLKELNQKLAIAGETLYRRGNFNGTFDQVICDALINVNDAEIALSPGFRWGTSILTGDQITMEHVLDQTCITYPNTYTNEMKGSDLKLILEDVADNLFNVDPYYQQGGDMVRVAGMDYEIDPFGTSGNRISNMTTDKGKLIDSNKTYKVSGWASVNSIPDGKKIWDVVKEHLVDQKTVKINKLNTPKIKNLKNNYGIENL